MGAIVTALANRMRDYLDARTTDVAELEQKVTGGRHGKAEDLLDQMFRVRHGLQTVKTMRLVVMSTISIVLLVWAKRRGWW